MFLRLETYYSQYCARIWKWTLSVHSLYTMDLKPLSAFNLILKYADDTYLLVP